MCLVPASKCSTMLLQHDTPSTVGQGQLQLSPNRAAARMPAIALGGPPRRDLGSAATPALPLKLRAPRKFLWHRHNYDVGVLPACHRLNRLPPCSRPASSRSKMELSAQPADR